MQRRFPQLARLILAIFLMISTSWIGSASAQTSSWSWSHLFTHQNNLWEAMASHLHLVERDASPQDIQKNVHTYLQQPYYLHQLSEHAVPYLYHVLQETQKRGMPAEIALMPLVESNYDPFAFSARGATGLWQIMPGTASGLGLTINWWFDGRRAVIGSTEMALYYIAYLHRQFGDWLLAIAAYDSGEGTVANAIARNKRLHRPTDFWSLSLPRETEQYIPKLLALADIVKHQRTYGVTLTPIANTPYFTDLTLHTQFDLNQLAKLAEITPEELRTLNPGFRRWATPPQGEYHLLVPVNYAPILQEHLQNYKQTPVKWSHHVVKAGESLSIIAGHYHTRVAILQRVNHIRGTCIHPNQDLLIPSTLYGVLPSTATRVNQHVTIDEDRIPGPQEVVHIVRARDTLSSIALRNHVSVREIRYWNNLRYATRLYIGEKLLIWESPRYFYHPPQRIAYTIRSGDTLSGIAHRFHLGTLILQRANPTLKGALIHPGKKLWIPSK